MEEPLLQLIEQYIDGEYAEEVPMVSGDAIGATVDYMQGRNRYIAHLIASANFSLQGVKVGLDCAALPLTATRTAASRWTSAAMW